jgi:hypothetical protein
MHTEDILVFSGPVLFTTAHLPVLDFSHISNLTDHTGIIQHALYSMPNRKEGYCIDDNSRALLLAVWACRYKKDPVAERLLPVYLSFIHYMQTDIGDFRNFMNYDKTCPEAKGSEDSFGRTIMALGYLVSENSSSFLVKTGEEIFVRALPHIDQLVSIRGMANSMIGLCQFIKFNYPDDLKKEMVTRIANKMVRMYTTTKTTDWHWFEPVLAYDNAILPLALLHAYELTNNEEYLSIAKQSMDFLESKVFYKGILRPVGNQGWCRKGGKPAQFDQQGIDAMAMVLYYRQAFHLTRDKTYLSKMVDSYQWFTGVNDLGLSLYDPDTGGCADGLHSEGINLNQGAESTLAYWISHMMVAATLQK